MTRVIHFPSYCQGCVIRHREKIKNLMTGYCVTSCKCDKCGRTDDLAIVQLREPERITDGTQ